MNKQTNQLNEEYLITINVPPSLEELIFQKQDLMVYRSSRREKVSSNDTIFRTCRNKHFSRDSPNFASRGWVPLDAPFKGTAGMLTEGAATRECSRTTEVVYRIPPLRPAFSRGVFISTPFFNSERSVPDDQL